LDISEAVRIYRYLNEPVGSNRDLFLLIEEILAKSSAKPWLKMDGLEIDEDGDIAYFAGCAPIFDILLGRDSNYSEATYSGIKVLNYLGIKPTIIYGCCGHDLYYSGRLDEFSELKEKMMEILGGKHIIVGCAEGYHILKNVYRVDVEHFSEFVERMGILDSLKKLDINTTYHDPCRLGRYNAIYQAPRDLIEVSSNFREMEQNRKDAICCGVGAWLNCNLDSKRMRIRRIEEALDCGADHLVTSCLKCMIHLDCLFYEKDCNLKRLEIIDLQELVAKSLGIYEENSKSYEIISTDGKPISQVKIEKDIKRYLNEELLDNVYKCSTCHLCSEVCPFDYNTTEMMEELRSYIVKEELNPVAHKEIYEKIEKYGNPYGESGFESKEEDSNIIYFPGCTSMYRRKGVMESTKAILDEIGMKYSIPQGMVCCGSILIRSGYKDHPLTRELMEKNKKIFGDKTIVVSCAGCYTTFKHDYDGVNVKHLAEFIKDKLKKISLKEVKSKVIYHDPCHLGRGSGLYEEPRDIIKMIPGTELLEFSNNRERAICCGSGGGVKSSIPDIANKLARGRSDDAEEAGAEIILSACPFCELNIGQNSKLETIDISEYLLRSLER
jgi:Fe-S oxidoreductase